MAPKGAPGAAGGGAGGKGRAGNKQARRAARRQAQAALDDGAPAARRKSKGQTKGDRPRRKRVTPPAPVVGPVPEDPDARTAFFEQAQQYASYLGVDAHGGSFMVATSDRHTGKHLFIKRGRPEFKVLTRAVTAVEILTGDHAIAGRVFVDVGANIGTSTVSALLWNRFGSAVSCEPEQENYRLLRASLALSGIEERVQTLPVAVSNRVARSNLVVTEGRGGQHWIALDPEKIRAVEAGRAARAAEDPGLVLPEMSVVEVELVTLDRLTETGVIDRDRVGMVWIDTEGHEGQVLEGASTLVDRGVPIVFEFHPAGLDERGDRGSVHEVAERCYTHFVDVRRQEADRPRFQLRPVTELPRLADRFLDPSTPGSFTDLLLLRLDAEQASVGANLPELFVGRSVESRPGESAS